MRHFIHLLIAATILSAAPITVAQGVLFPSRTPGSHSRGPFRDFIL